jgi:hypothetical protein
MNKARFGGLLFVTTLDYSHFLTFYLDCRLDRMIGGARAGWSMPVGPALASGCRIPENQRFRGHQP